MIARSFFARPVVDVARDLIGVHLLVGGVGGIIVETEAYDRNDAASHSFSGQTARNAVMFGAAGFCYVYRSYGIHWCMNFVCGAPGGGSAVLIRAVEPVWGIEIMQGRRNLHGIAVLCAGPGRLCQALGVGSEHNGLPLDAPPFALEAPRDARHTIVIGPRIGISKAVDTPWRFGLAGSRFLSRRFPAPTTNP